MKSKIHKLQKANYFSASKKAIIYLSLIAVLINCNQKKDTLKNTTMTTDKLTKDNYVATMLKEIKHYPKEPFYQIYVANSLCIYELLVNDFPIQKAFEYEQQATPIYINIGILKSGKQKVTIRLYPAPAEFNGRYGDVFSPDTKCGIELYVNDNAKGLPVDGNILLQQVQMPTTIRIAGENNDFKIPEFAGKGQKYYEHSFYFDAEVPYSNKGWSNGQDLRKLDQKELGKAVLGFYKMQWNIYNEKDENNFLSYFRNRDKETNQAEFNDENDLKSILEQYIEPFKSSSYKMQPLENYKTMFYGDGRIVLLELNSMNPKLRGKSAHWSKYKTEDGSNRGRSTNFFLYLPQGKSLNELEVIR